MTAHRAILLLAAIVVSSAAHAARKTADVTLPATFKDVAHAPDFSPFKSMFRSFTNDNGTLVISASSIQYAAKDKQLVIPVTDIRGMAQEGNPKAPWLVIEYVESGQVRRVGFQGSSFRGEGLRLAEMQDAIRLAMATETVPKSETPVETARRLLETETEKAVQQFPSAAEALTKYLESHPQDVDALILSARMTYMLMAFDRTGNKPSPEATFGAAHKLLDRALAVQPDNAEATFWKSAMFAGETKLDEATRYGRRAVELAPKEDRYKEQLAGLLLEQKKPKEALKVLAEARGGQHPVYLLLGDLESFPIPEKAVIDDMKTAEMSVDQFERGRATDNIYMRLRVYIAPLTLAEIEAFYKQRFPSFALGEPAARDNEEKVQMTSYMYSFRRTASGWDVIHPRPKDPQDGMLMLLTELRGVDEERRKNLPLPVGEVYCAIVVQNLRKVSP